MSEIIQIVPYLPPSISGVADYAYLLARELRAKHDIRTCFLVCDPGWNGGDYETQPQGLKVAIEVLYFMSSNPLQRQKDGPTLQRADEALDNYIKSSVKTMDANDVLYAVQSSYDYDPGPGLEKIQAPLLAVNFADDLINPPELGILEKEIGRVEKGRAIVFPLSDETRGHGTHTLAAVWKKQLEDLLNCSATK